MVVELASGGSLKHWLGNALSTKGGITASQFHIFAVYILRGLAYIHGRKVCVRVYDA
ncbi:MAG: hypothetical protein P4L40_06500 [Terracidiphilus sp.]|nr:hypothetical protein [Terracidiphilus sp.]